MLRRLCLALPVFTLMVLVPAPAQAVPDPVNCTGYPEQRVYLDSQSWWIRGPGQTGDDFGHAHAATCFPLQKTVSGTVQLDVKVTMHNNPGWLGSLTVQLFKNGTGYTGAQKKFTANQYTCAPGLTCDFWFTMNVNTTKVPTDGTVEWRIRPKVNEPDGQNMNGSTSYQTTLANGKPVSNFRPLDFLQGKGWYTGIEYSQARLIDTEFPYNTPTSGSWTFEFECDSTLLPLSECLVSIDPNHHAGNKGTVLYENTAGGGGVRTATIDYSTLAPGAHKLVIRAGTKDTVQGSTQYGILGVPFAVD